VTTAGRETACAAGVAASAVKSAAPNRTAAATGRMEEERERDEGLRIVRLLEVTSPGSNPGGLQVWPVNAGNRRGAFSS
jgi:hypothetical protein